MKKNYLFLFFMLLGVISLNAAVFLTKNVPTAGGLSASLTASEKTTVTNLIVTGTINAQDVACIRDEMTVLAVVDLSAVNIASYKGAWGTLNRYGEFPANEMPTYSFYNQDAGGSAKLSLTQCILPNSITSIGEAAFVNCKNLTSIVIPNLVTVIKERAFWECGGLTGDLVIPNSVISIDYLAFYNCINLNGTLTLGNSVSSIAEGAFKYTSFTGPLTLPNSITSIPNGAFWSARFTGTLIIPNSVTSIGTNAFRVSQFTTVIIPSAVTSIGDYAFGYTNNLTTFKLKGSTPPTITANTFENVDRSKVSLEVPFGAVSAYQNDPLWAGFMSYKEAAATFYDNLLLNPSCDNNDFSAWTAVNGGSGWAATNKSWVSSYLTCEMTQTVDLIALGFTAAELDASPYILASGSFECPWSGGNSIGNAKIIVTLLGASNNTLGTITVANTNYKANDIPWNTYAKQQQIPAGTRKIMFNFAGTGSNNWSGQYGPRFDDMRLSLSTTVPTNHAVTVATVPNGSFTSDKATASAGEIVKITVNPTINYTLKAINITTSFGSKISVASDNTFIMPTGFDVVVSGEFNPSQNTDYFRSVASGNWDTNTTWESSLDGTNWGTTPLTPSSSAASVSILDGHLVTIAADATASTLIVAPGAKLTLNSGKTLTATTLTLKSDASGSASFVNYGTLNSTTTNVQQYLTAGRNWYISSPVSGAQSSVFSPTVTNPLYYFVEPNSSNASTRWAQITAGTTNLNPTTGYIANMNATVLANKSNVVTFTGALNNGNYTAALTRTTSQQRPGYNLIGNPYPSYMNWSDVTRTDVDPTIWYRTKVGEVYKYYTYLPGTGAREEDGISVPAGVTNLIPPMQAFWVRVSAEKTTGSVGFTNTIREHRDQTTNIFRAPVATKSARQLVRLQVSNGVNDDETVIYFNSNASTGFDTYDSPKMSNDNVAIPEIYTTSGAESLIINGMNAIPYDTELALGFKTGQSNSFTLQATEINNLDGVAKLIIKDKKLNVEQELALNVPYAFSSDVDNSVNRFSLIFRSNSVIQSAENIEQASSALIYCNENNQITVNYNNAIASNAKVEVYNAMGQKLASQRMTSAITVINKALLKGVYMVNVVNDAKSSTQKVILK